MATPANDGSARLGGDATHVPPSVRELDFRLDAVPFWLSPLRSMITDLALRSEFDLDRAADLVMAMDEAVAALVQTAGPDERITGRLAVDPGGVTVRVELPPGPPPCDRSIDPGPLGWRVLRTLADHVELLPDGILFTKAATPAG